MNPSSFNNKIIVRGAKVHNLRNISTDIPHQKLTVITGPSGSGKSSLAFDTLHAEGQRRYIETFSTYARQFLEQLEKPDVDQLEGLSPTIAILQKTTSYNPRSTVGTVTEILDYLRVLYAKISEAHCPQCGNLIQALSTQQIVDYVLSLPQSTKLTLFSPIAREKKGEFLKEQLSLRQQGFTKIRIDGTLQELAQPKKLEKNYKHTLEVVIDRIIIKAQESSLNARLFESIELALKLSKGYVLLSPQEGNEILISQNFACAQCDYFLPTPEPRIFSFNSPMGACKTCDGLGVLNFSEEQNDNDDEDTTLYQIDKICTDCNGSRLSPQSLAFKIGNKNIAETCALSIEDLERFILNVKTSSKQKTIAEPLLKEIRERIGFLIHVGVTYLSLDRPLYSLSGGESQRIRLASQLGSKLIGITYILDEPSIGLHPRDNHLLIESLKELRDMGNTIIVVEHDEEMMLASDHLIDMGPGAGALGGTIMSEGSPQHIIQDKNSLTGLYLSHQKSSTHTKNTVIKPKSFLKLEHATSHNLKNVTVEFPLETLTVVTGVSGSGKSSLIIDTLYPLLLNQFYRTQHDIKMSKITQGLEHLDKVIQIDQAPIGRTPRSNPATYTGVFSHIRNLFSQLPEAKLRAFKAGRFSFNVKGGRCDECEGDGVKKISMSFMPDAYVRCNVCKGTRFKEDTLHIQYKGKNIADILNMSVDEAVVFFKNIPSVYEKLRVMNEVGLGYIKLGQEATSLSGGEAQRIKLSKELARVSTGKTIYILDEPSTGLHFEDISKLLNILRKLVELGNTVIVIEHNLDIIAAADHIIDVGPEGGERGGMIVATGTPSQISKNTKSKLSSFLANKLASMI